MRRCRSCNGPLPENSAPQRKFCEHPDCKRDRNAYGQTVHRARVENTLTRVHGEQADPIKRTTSLPRDDNDRDEDWAYGAGAGAWDKISLAWQHGRLPTVDRLMAKSERSLGGSRPLANRRYGESAPPAPVRSNWHFASARRLLPDSEDWGSPGELWLRGERERSVKRAEKERRYVIRLAERGS